MPLRRTVFDLGAWPYDLLTRHPYWRDHCVRMMERFVAGHVGRRRRILDLGCGPGVSALAFKDEAPDDQVVGLDISQPMVRRALRHDSPRRCAWLRGDALRLPIATGSVDVVTGHSFLYLIPDRRGALREIRRVLRPGGKLVLMEPRRQGWAKDGSSVARLFWAVGPSFALSMSLWRVAAAASGAFRPGDLEAVFVEEGFEGAQAEATLEGLGWLATALRPVDGVGPIR